MYKFTIYGDPVGKQRARTVNCRGKIRSYTPEKTTNYSTLARLSFLQENPDFKTIEKDVPVVIIFNIYLSIPKSVSKKKRELMLSNKIRPTKKPDFDNVEKSICDALNGVAYTDDAQIVDSHTHKYYSETPRVEVVVGETLCLGVVGTTILFQALVNKLAKGDEK